MTVRPFLDKLIPTGPLADMLAGIRAGEMRRLKRADDRAAFEIVRLRDYFRLRPAANRPTRARGLPLVDKETGNALRTNADRAMSGRLIRRAFA